MNQRKLGDDLNVLLLFVVLGSVQLVDRSTMLDKQTDGVLKLLLVFFQGLVSGKSLHKLVSELLDLGKQISLVIITKVQLGQLLSDIREHSVRRSPNLLVFCQLSLRRVKKGLRNKLCVVVY